MFGITFTGSSVDLWVIIIYFIVILGFGSIFGRYTKTTKDFFFGGQRFSWWLISMSCVATLVGSYSFIKYSEYAYKYGTSSSMSYLNDVFIMPLFVFGWLPLIYFSRVTSVPEFFEKRFNKMARFLVTVLIMIYLLGYIGYNLYTMGIAIEKVLGIDIYFAVIATATVCAIYVAAGGQTAVIMTDLVQGFLLLFAGFLLFGLGLSYVGGFTAFWDKLPISHRLPFTGVTTPAEFCTAGIFWQDGIANSMVFYFMNQGMILRFLSAKSVKEGRKALIVMALVIMPLTMIAVSNAGWIGKAIPTEEIIQTEVAMENQVLEAKGLPVHPDQPIDPARTPNTKTMFVTVAKLISTPGIFGFIMAALVAALMSTIDTLINASSVIFVNDIWRPYIKPNRTDKHYLNVARTFSLLAAFIGVLLVPMFAGFKSLYEA
ncbi:MAG TPA: sodium:solute symporter family protein, partial [Planctomycetota bacterium]|nr:sodium:solute symporter family protein [Planctomycetota bacterium]